MLVHKKITFDKIYNAVFNRCIRRPVLFAHTDKPETKEMFAEICRQEIYKAFGISCHKVIENASVSSYTVNAYAIYGKQLIDLMSIATYKIIMYCEPGKYIEKDYIPTDIFGNKLIYDNSDKWTNNYILSQYSDLDYINKGGHTVVESNYKYDNDGMLNQTLRISNDFDYKYPFKETVDFLIMMMWKRYAIIDETDKVEF